MLQVEDCADIIGIVARNAVAKTDKRMIFIEPHLNLPSLAGRHCHLSDGVDYDINTSTAIKQHCCFDYSVILCE